MNVYVNNKQLNLNVCELENDLNTLKHPIRSRYRGFYFYNNGLINDLDAVKCNRSRMLLKAEQNGEQELDDST